MKLEFISAIGEIMPLTGNSRFKLSNVDGITVDTVDLATSTNPHMDGDIVNNTRSEARDVILDLTIEGDLVEEVKRYILKYVKPKKRGILRLTQNDRTTQLVGIVSGIDMPRFANPVVMQISLHFSQPHWEDIAEAAQDVSEVVDMFYFTDYDDDMLYFPAEGIPFGEIDTNRTKVLTNEGDVDVGLEIHITALGIVTNPVLYNVEGEYIGVDITMEAGDEVIITTDKGNKTVRLNGENKISKIREGSTWLQLKVGENEFTIDSEDGTEGNMYFTLVYKQRYV